MKSVEIKDEILRLPRWDYEYAKLAHPDIVEDLDWEHGNLPWWLECGTGDFDISKSTFTVKNAGTDITSRIASDRGYDTISAHQALRKVRDRYVEVGRKVVMAMKNGCNAMAEKNIGVERIIVPDYFKKICKMDGRAMDKMFGWKVHYIKDNIMVFLPKMEFDGFVQFQVI